MPVTKLTPHAKPFLSARLKKAQGGIDPGQLAAIQSSGSMMY